MKCNSIIYRFSSSHLVDGYSIHCTCELSLGLLSARAKRYLRPCMKLWRNQLINKRHDFLERNSFSHSEKLAHGQEIWTRFQHDYNWVNLGTDYHFEQAPRICRLPCRHPNMRVRDNFFTLSWILGASASIECSKWISSDKSICLWLENCAEYNVEHIFLNNRISKILFTWTWHIHTTAHMYCRHAFFL